MGNICDKITPDFFHLPELGDVVKQDDRAFDRRGILAQRDRANLHLATFARPARHLD